jgi:hypothetical protein
MGRAFATDFINARNVGGGSVANLLVGRQTGQRLNSLNQFASDDATKMGQNIQYSDNFRKFLQGENNRQVGQQMDYRMNDERATGAMLSSGLNNVASGVNANQALNNSTVDPSVIPMDYYTGGGFDAMKKAAAGAKVVPLYSGSYNTGTYG